MNAIPGLKLLLRQSPSCLNGSYALAVANWDPRTFGEKLTLHFFLPIRMEVKNPGDTCYTYPGYGALPVMLQLVIELISSVAVNGVVVCPGNTSILLCSVQCM